MTTVRHVPFSRTTQTSATIQFVVPNREQRLFRREYRALRNIKTVLQYIINKMFESSRLFGKRCVKILSEFKHISLADQLMMDVIAE